MDARERAYAGNPGQLALSLRPGALGPRFRGDERILYGLRGVRHDMEDGRLLYVPHPPAITSTARGAAGMTR